MCAVKEISGKCAGTKDESAWGVVKQILLQLQDSSEFPDKPKTDSRQWEPGLWQRLGLAGRSSHKSWQGWGGK